MDQSEAELRAQYEREKQQYEQYQREKRQYEEQQRAARQAARPSGDGGKKRSPRDLTVGEQVVGAVRQAANAVTFGQYPRMVGAVNRIPAVRSINRMLGRDDEDAAKLGQYMAEYRQRAPGQAEAARFVGEVVPYMTGPGAVRGVGRLAQTAGRMVNPQAMARVEQALGAVGSAAGRGYGAAKNAPVVGSALRAAQGAAGRVLPRSAGSAAQIATLEGARGVLEPAEDGQERTLGEVATDVAKRIGGGLLGGKMGEVIGTRIAATVGPTLGKVATGAKSATEKAGEAISAWKGGEPIQFSDEAFARLAKLYDKSKLLRDAVNQEAENLGLTATHPTVLARAYSAVSRAVRGTPDAADVQKMVLQPFLKEIDTAAQGPLSPLIRRYAAGKGSEEAVQAAQRTVSYLRTGKGDPFRSSPEAMAQWAGRSYRSNEERQAAAQALISALSQGGTAAGPLWQRAMRPFKGAGEVANLVEQLGGTPSFAQRMAQRAGRGVGAVTGSRFMDEE